MTPSPLATTSEVAAHLRIDPRTLRRLVAAVRGGGPPPPPAGKGTRR